MGDDADKPWPRPSGAQRAGGGDGAPRGGGGGLGHLPDGNLIRVASREGSICPEPKRPGEGRDRAPRIQIATWLALEYVPPRGPTICLLQKTSPTRAATSAPKL